MIPFSKDVIDRYRQLGAWGDTTIWKRFSENCAAHPDREALVDDPGRERFTDGTSRRLTYAELNASANVLAAVMADQGLAKDDIILVQLPNITEQIELYLAAAKLGIIISPMPVQYRQKEITDVVSAIGPKAVFTGSSIAGFDHASLFLNQIDIGDAPVLAWGDQVPDGAIDLRGVLEAAEEGSLSAADVSADDIYTICWTSGTEAAPKGVPRTHNNWIAIGNCVVAGGGLREGCRLLNPFPTVNMASIGGLFMPWLETAGALILHHPFDPAVFMGQLAGEKINYTVVPPVLLNRLLQQPEFLAKLDLENLDGIGTGASPPDPWMMEGFQNDYNVIVTNFFGSNEGVALVAGVEDVADPTARARFFPRVGRPEFRWKNDALNWNPTKLIDQETGVEILEPGVPGELVISGPAVFPGYYKNGEISDLGFDEDGFYASGDLFEIAEDDTGPRFYRFVGRKKEIIIRGGMNISPAEIDEVLSRHPKITEAAAAGYPDENLGEKVCAFVVPTEGETLQLEEITAFLTEQGLAKYKMPEKLVALKALPRNPLNKVLRTELTASLR